MELQLDATVAIGVDVGAGRTDDDCRVQPRIDHRLAVVVQAGTPNLHTVGWDVAVLYNGPVVVEANWRYDIDSIQVAYSKGFKPVLEENLAF